MILVVVVLITKVLPVFGEVYRQLGSEMSPAAAAIMNFGVAVSAHWRAIVVVLAVIAAVIAACVLAKPLHAAFAKLFTRLRSEKGDRHDGGVYALCVRDGHDDVQRHGRG